MGVRSENPTAVVFLDEQRTKWGKCVVLKYRTWLYNNQHTWHLCLFMTKLFLSERRWEHDTGVRIWITTSRIILVPLTLSVSRFPPLYTSPCNSFGRTFESPFDTQKIMASSALWPLFCRNSCAHPLTFQKWFLLDLQYYVPKKEIKSNALLKLAHCSKCTV